MSRLFVVHPGRPDAMPWEVLSFDRTTHRLTFRRPDGTEGVDPNFHVDFNKRLGYILTAEIPPQFRR